MKTLITLIVLSIVYIPMSKEEAHNGYNSCYSRDGINYWCAAILDEETREVRKLGPQE